MFSSNTHLTERQIRSFDHFLLWGTDRAILALEEVFGLEVERSDSNIEVALPTDSVFLSHLSKEKLYAVSCSMGGDLEGRISLLLRASDFSGLGRVMQPILSLLFLANPDSDLESLEHDKPAWLRPEPSSWQHDPSFHRRMMDVLGELGNVLIGMYAQALFRTFQVSTCHSLPHASEGSDAAALCSLMGDASAERLHLVIENEFSIDGSVICMWLVVSPTRQSFQQLLHLTRH